MLLLAASSHTATVHAFVPPSPLPSAQSSLHRLPRTSTAVGAAQRRGGAGGMAMLLNLNKKESTAPPFATEEEREKDPGIKVRAFTHGAWVLCGDVIWLIDSWFGLGVGVAPPNAIQHPPTLTPPPNPFNPHVHTR